MENRYEYEVHLELSFDGDDEAYNSIFRYFDTYEEALAEYNILNGFSSCASVKIMIIKDANVLKEAILKDCDED